MIKFGIHNTDIRMNLFNYNSPIAQITIDGINYRIVEGLIHNRRKTYLLYVDGVMMNYDFNSVKDIKALFN